MNSVGLTLLTSLADEPFIRVSEVRHLPRHILLDPSAERIIGIGGGPAVGEGNGFEPVGGVVAEGGDAGAIGLLNRVAVLVVLVCDGADGGQFVVGVVVPGARLRVMPTFPIPDGTIAARDWRFYSYSIVKEQRTYEKQVMLKRLNLSHVGG